MRALVVLSLFCALAAEAKPVTLTARDGVKVYGEYVAPPKGSHKPLIVLFHQAQSSHNEYAPIQPKLQALGYGSLSIDQRSGGEMYGENRTVTALKLKKEADYQEAMPDFEAALAWAVKRSPTHKAIVWGSSYSAALAFPLTAAHPDQVAAVMAFSPAEYFDQDPHQIRTAAAKVTVPIFATSAPKKQEIEEAKAILAAAPAKTKVQFVPKEGVHGSSILRTDRDPKGAADAWNAVKDFLAQLR